MKTNTKNQIAQLLLKAGPKGPSSIAASLQISPQMVHRHLKAMHLSGDIKKQGTPPKVLYMIVERQSSHLFPTLPDDADEYIKRNYLAVKPDGQILPGLEGFKWWALKTKQHKHFKAVAHEYVLSHKKYNQQYRNELGIISATFKIKDTFEKCFLDHLFYQEFYSLPKFGKTKTGQLVFLGKSGQDVKSIKKLAEFSRQSIEKIIAHYNIDGVAFAPHSIPRKIAFLKVFKDFLALNIPTTTLKKVFVNNIPVAQKSLSKLEDRIENASNTIFTHHENSHYKRLLVIDDAVGSGATLNIIAEKLKRDAGVEFVCGYAVTGSTLST